MTEKELWKYFWDKKVYHSRPFDRDFLWIKSEDFEPVEAYFVKEFNILHFGKSFRSQGYMSHIHAVVQDDFIFAHKDTGNLTRFFPLGIIHLFVDVIPYFVFALVKRVPMKSIFIRPQ